MRKQIYMAIHDLKVTCGDLNVPQFKRAFALEGAAFDQFWSALDLLEDTAEALDDFAVCDNETGLGRLYLDLFGVLQCLTMQQDGIKTVYRCLDCSLNCGDHATLARIRQIRNRVCHASNVKGGSARSIQVLRLGLSHDSAQIICWTNGTSERVYFNPVELIRAQNELILNLIVRAGAVARDRIDGGFHPVASDTHKSTIASEGLCR